MKIAHQIEEDMLVHAKSRGHDALIGTVKDIKRGRYIKLHRRDSPDDKRRYIPLEWVSSVTGNTVHLSKDAATVRLEWLDKAAIKDQHKHLNHKKDQHEHQNHKKTESHSSQV